MAQFDRYGEWQVLQNKQNLLGEIREEILDEVKSFMWDYSVSFRSRLAAAILGDGDSEKHLFAKLMESEIYTRASEEHKKTIEIEVNNSLYKMKCEYNKGMRENPVYVEADRLKAKKETFRPYLKELLGRFSDIKSKSHGLDDSFLQRKYFNEYINFISGDGFRELRDGMGAIPWSQSFISKMLFDMVLKEFEGL